MRDTYQNEQAWQQVLATNQLAAASLPEFIGEGIKSEKLRDIVTKEATIDADELRTHYERHHSEYQLTEEVAASHILVKDEKLAKDLIAKLKNGEDFTKLAKEFSQDNGSKEQGGDLGFFPRGRMVSEFEEAAFKANSGEILLAKTQFGFHVIKVTGKHAAKTRSFAEASSQIQTDLLRKRADELFRQWLEKQRTSAKIAIRPQYQTPEAPRPAKPSSATGTVEVLAPVSAHSPVATVSPSGKHQ
ncbi:MAG: peptidylprolyl isomerase [Cyanobacteria bacterium NC_groundwater_1444_Ag_S-0.65um_54_12]|nr:peptidylprolyl isomerase [Cyanobacteria bacterium NC_groundwater_1444_Ag_S-0.65um_54_12]